MARILFSLIVKKYSLKPVKYQIAIQSLLIGFVCLFCVLPVSINDTVVQLSIKQALVFASMLSVSIGCVNAFVELQSHETKLVYLVSGKRILSSIRILFVELCDVVLQSTLYFIVLLIWFHFFSSENGVSLEIFSFYLIGSIQYFLISYFLSYFFKMRIQVRHHITNHYPPRHVMLLVNHIIKNVVAPPKYPDKSYLSV